MKHLQRELEALSTMTNETNPAAIAASLTAGEREALKRISNNVDAIGFYPQLKAKGLIEQVASWFGYERGLDDYRWILTDLGKRVLAALETPAAADARPPVISAKEFVEQGYAAKIAAGECVVVDETPYHVRTDHRLTVREIVPPNVEGRHIHSCDVIYWNERDGHNYGWANVDDERTKLTVTWLTPATAQPAPDNGGGAVVDWQAQALKAEADLASMYSTAEHMYSEAHDNYTAIWKLVTSNIGDWDYPAQVIRHVGHMVDDLAAANAALAAARERLARVEGALKPFGEIYHEYTTHMIETTWFGNFSDYLAEFYGSSDLNVWGHNAYEALRPQAASALAQDAAEGAG